LVWGIALKENNQIIGGIDLTNFVNRRMVDLGFYLSREHWNHGYMGSFKQSTQHMVIVLLAK